MATLNLTGWASTPRSISHVIPGAFAGSAVGVSRAAADFANTTYRNYVAALGLEWMRFHYWSGGATQIINGQPSGQTATDDDVQGIMTATRNFAIFLAMPSMLQINIRPNPTTPATQPARTYSAAGGFASNIQPNGTDGSPRNLVNQVATWLAAGIDLRWVEGYNEPANNRDGGGQRWYTGTTAGFDAATNCEAWCSVHQRDFYAEMRSRFPSLKVCTGVYATNEAGYGIAGGRSNMRGQSDFLAGGAGAIVNNVATGWPHADSNFPYWDIHTNHPYPGTAGGQGTGTNQSVMNSLFYTTAAIEAGTDGTPNRARMTAWHNMQRAWLNTNGQSAKRFGHTEYGWLLPDYRGALGDAAYAIATARDCARWGLDFICFFSLIASWDTSQSIFIDNIIVGNSNDTAFTRTVRYYGLLSMTLPYLKKYKQQLFDGTRLLAGPNSLWVVRPGTTGIGNDNNPVERLQVSAGINAAGDKMGILVANVDLVTHEVLTVQLGFTPPAAIAWTKVPTTQANESALPTGTIAANSTFAQDILGGESWLFEVPLSGTVTVVTPVNITAPVITGTPVTGNNLVASTGTWSNGPTAFAYQWIRGSTDITGAVSSSYVVVSADEGSTLKVRVTASNSAGSAPATSVATASVTSGGGPSSPTQATLDAASLTAMPNIFGTTNGTVNITVTANTNRYMIVAVAGRYGVSPSSISYSGVPLTQIVSVDQGNAPNRIELWGLVAPATGTHSLDLTYPSSMTAAVEAAVYYNVDQTTPYGNVTSTHADTTDSALNVVATSAQLVIGASCTMANTAATLTDSVNQTSLTARQALAGGVGVLFGLASRQGINGSTGISWTSTGQYWATAGLELNAVVAATAPVNTVVPVVSGTATVGQTLSATTGTFVNNPTDANLTITYAYQWQRDTAGDGVFANISSATNSTYVLAAADVANTIRVSVIATNSVGSTLANSTATSVVATGTPVVVAPANTVLPVISDTTPTVGDTLTSTTGTWTGTPTAFAYQWARGSTSIGGAANSSYVVTTDDVGSTIRVTVSATNDGGVTAASSAATSATVAAAVTTPPPVPAGVNVIGGTRLIDKTKRIIGYLHRIL